MAVGGRGPPLFRPEPRLATRRYRGPADGTAASRRALRAGLHRFQAVKDRLARCVRDWGVTVESTLDTQSSILAFGTRGDRAVALKVVRAPGDEWRAGEILAAFRGEGTVRVLAQRPGAALLERAVPGTSLASLVLEGGDDEATGILADVVLRMGGSSPTMEWAPTAEDWGRGFRRYLESGDAQVPAGMVDRAGEIYARLCASRQHTRLLHG